MGVPEKKEDAKDEKKKKKSEDVAKPKVKKDAEPSVAATVEDETEENGVEANFEQFNNQWLENFESLMADASLDDPHQSSERPSKVRLEGTEGGAGYDPWRFYADVMNMG